jgi:drug/metabolite transporter (DMT)-like permease
VFGTGLAYVASSTLLGRAGPTRGSVQIYFIPVVALVLGVVFLDEEVGAMALTGVALIILGAYLTSRSERHVDVATATPVEPPDR